MNEIRLSIIIPNRKIRIKGPVTKTISELSIFMDIFTICQHTQSLPKPGGLLDQDGLYVVLLRHALVCQDERRQLDEAKAKQEHQSVNY